MMVDLVVLERAPAELPAGAARPRSSPRCHASHEAGDRSTGRAACSSGGATCSARRAARCCARPRACTSPCDGRSLGPDPRGRGSRATTPVTEDLASLPAPTRSADRGGRDSAASAPMPAPLDAARDVADLGRDDAGADRRTRTRRRRPTPDAAPAHARQRLRRARPGRRLRDRGRGRPGAAGAVGQRHRQPARRLRRHRARRGFTWAENSYFYRLTPWHNDPVSDPAERGAVPAGRGRPASCGAPTPAPIRATPAATPSATARASTTFDARARRHRHARSPSACAEDAPVKLVGAPADQPGRPTPRRLTVTAYVEWTLGVLREHTQHQVAHDVRSRPARDPRAATPSTRSSPTRSRSAR